jgi:phage repressor protein C with HTH and peptisase S24 domain
MPPLTAPVQVVEVAGESMLPALRPGDRLVIRRGARVRPGDIVLARQDGVLMVKRVFRREAGGWWLESDNQKAPGRRDSWDFGPVADQNIVGRVVGCYWPPSRLSFSAPALSRRRAR